jgi:hypothetical protein
MSMYLLPARLAGGNFSGGLVNGGGEGMTESFIGTVRVVREVCIGVFVGFC